MTGSYESPKLSILHVLTLNGRNGEYGGPVRVAREICLELNKRGNRTSIFSGAIKGAEPIPLHGISESFVLVRPILKKVRISSMWSWHLYRYLTIKVRNSDLIHIHFARDLISFLAALVAILHKKPFVVQTHGMLIHDGRWSTKFIDTFLTRPLLKYAGQIFALSQKEKSALERLKFARSIEILPNGVNANLSSKSWKENQNRIVFCSRLEKRKGIDKFIELAFRLRNSNYKFEVYGPDCGELVFLLEQINKLNLHGILDYKGALQTAEVQQMLMEVDLVVLPSKDEPFPMIVLEALAVGTSVLVMPSCGISMELKNFRSFFVSKSENTDGLVKSLEISMSRRNKKERDEIMHFCREYFSIKGVADTLEHVYHNLLLKKQA